VTASAFTLGQTGRLLARLVVLFSAGLGWPVAFCQTSPGIIVSSFGEDEIGSDVTAWSAVQDPAGIIYFGGHELISFDGQRWNTTPVAGTYALRGLDFDRNGRLWVGAVGEIGWFDRSPNGWTFQSLRTHLPFEPAKLGAVWQVFVEPRDTVFIAEEKILRWDGQRFQVWSMPGARRLQAVRLGETIYVHHRPTGIYTLGPEGPVKIIPAEILPDASIYWLEPRANGGWLLVTPKGLFQLQEGRFEPFAAEASKIIQRGSLTSVTRLPDGRLAAGTMQSGIVLIRDDGTLDRVLDESSGLPTHTIYSLFCDAEKGLWATSSNRIFRVSLDSPSEFLDQRVGLPRQQIHAILRHHGQLLVAMETDLYQQTEAGREFQLVSEVSGRAVDIRSTPQGLLLGRARSVALWSQGTPKVLYSTVNDANLVKPSRLTPENLLISDNRKIVSLDGGTQPRVLVENLPDVATTIAEDQEEQLWIGTTTRGVLLAKPNRSGPVEARVPPADLGLPKLASQAAAIATKDGTIIVLAPEGGWALRPRAEKFVAIAHYPAQRKIASFSYVGSDDSLWVVHAATGARPSSVARIHIGSTEAIWESHFVEGLGQIGAPSGFLAEANSSQETTLWIGGTKGMLRHSVAHGLSAPTPHAPVLRAYSRAGETTQLQAIAAPLPYSTNAIYFRFAAPQFSLAPSLRLETFLEGVDHDWTPAEPSAQRQLTALRDGRYTFRARVVAETGNASEPATFQFTVLPPWWRSTPALTGAAVALALGIFGSFRLRELSLRRRNAELEAKVSQRTAQLAQANAAKTEFVANMSHDIRNPLNGIVGLALALEDTSLDSKQREIVSTLRECTTYLSSLVDDVLDFASIEAGQLELRLAPFAPAELLRSVVTTLKGEAAEQGATLLIEAAPNLPPALLGDAGRIQQILVNYAGNALKYAGGTIRLTAKLSDDSADEIEFAVSDEGPGITPADQAKLFTKFNRLANARGDSIKGSGLGLAACRSLADIMSGSVGVISQREVGSTFYLRLPLAVSQPPVEAPEFALPSATVLIVEDADYNAWAATAVLNKLGLPCERARNGREALELFRRKRFDVVLLDRNLPDMDGTEVAKRLREIEADNPRAILLAVTAYCTAEDRALCLASGMDAFVGKPLTPAKLRKVLLAAGRRLLAAASVHVSPETGPSPTVDLSLLSYITDGTEQGLGEQIERFLAALAQEESQLEHASSAGDLSAVAASAHQLLSQAKMVGDTALETAAASLETAARAQDAASAGLLFEPVRREIRALTEALRRRRPATYAT
jgi:signal transduction histidine kinase/CheY-like chemotaxis protein/ligand-binding sensor domain-containing protein